MRRILLAVMVSGSVAAAQTAPPKTRWPCKKSAKQSCAKTIDIGPLMLDGRVHKLSMLDFLERANEELERASLEKKSFVPKLIQTIDEAAL